MPNHNEKYEIIDGQHRFEAVKELQKEIYFIKVKGLELDQVRRLNTNTKGWNCENFQVVLQVLFVSSQQAEFARTRYPVRHSLL